ncbi:unnamed protein product [Angiostrongylus costaricensis]|uniref:Glucuronosyltransferase n=1 Tax=Angiostrongylus costaricensis TaxID=334426 RepID=A0A0R3PBZ0_ANGCS|nr:unnamed protein product [Angiostrongylus costaricensis]
MYLILLVCFDDKFAGVSKSEELSVRVSLTVIQSEAMILLFLVILTSFTSQQSSAFKMALFVPDLANSQVLFNARVAETLAKGGHDVTMVMISSVVGQNSEDVRIMEGVKGM